MRNPSCNFATGQFRPEPGVSTLEDKTSRKVALVASRIWQVLEATRWKVTPSRKR